MIINANVGYFDSNTHELWTVIYDLFALVCVKNNKIIFVHILDEIPNIRDIISYEEKIYYFVANKPGIWIVERNTKEVKYITYESSDIKFPISNVVLYNEVAYILSELYIDNILCLNLNTGDQELIQFPMIVEKESVTRASVYKNIICFCSRTENHIHMFLLNCLNKSIISVNLKDARFVKCQLADKEGIFILYQDKHGNAILEKRRYDLKQEFFITLKNLNLGSSNRLTHFRMLKNRDSIFLIQTEGIKIVCVDLKKQDVKYIGIDIPRITKECETKNKFYEALDIGDGILLFSINSGHLFEMKYDEPTIDIYDISLDDLSYIYIVKNIIEKNKILSESPSLMLTSFVEGITM